MHDLEMTWTREGDFFLWPAAPSTDSSAPDWSGVLGGRPTSASLTLVAPSPRPHRQSFQGWRAPLHLLLPTLAEVSADADVRPSAWWLARATQLALELCIAHQVAPYVKNGQCHWRATFTRPRDRSRLASLAETLPTSARAQPTSDEGPIRLATSQATLHDLIDAVVDLTYRSNAHPGTARGWPLAMAEALRGATPALSLTDARWRTMPEQLERWSTTAREGSLALAIHLDLPSGAKPAFPLRFEVTAPGHTGTVPLKKAWKAGGSLKLGGQHWSRPALQITENLARAARLHPPFAAALDGPEPHNLVLNASEAWMVIQRGRSVLADAGFDVILPPAFRGEGPGRLVPRMVVEGASDLTQALRFRWEVRLGDDVLDGPTFARLVAQNSPIVRHEQRWVLLDPASVALLPPDLTSTGTLPPAVALRAVLLGELDGVEVVADDRLELILEALRNPADRPVPPDLNGTLRPYQHRGLSWLAALGDLGLGCALGDDMGLGKTVQLIAHLLDRQATHTEPSLVICPTSLLGNWRRELARFAPTLRTAVYHGPSRNPRELDEVDVVVTSYGVLVSETDNLASRSWDVVALDEAQAIKNPDSQRARAARELQANHRVALSGTPVENRLDELWSLFAFMIPGLLGPRGTFRREVAIPVERFGDADVAERLKRGVAPFILRRLKSDPTIISDLPEKFERVEWTQLTTEQRDLYKQVTDDHLEMLASAEPKARRGQVLALLTALKQVCNHPAQLHGQTGPLAGRSGKLDRTTALLKNIRENNEQAILFTQYRVMGELLATHLRDTLGISTPFLHGGVSVANREEMVADFQAGATPVLLISLRAGGTGLNLTRATHVLHYDRWWNPAVEDQATDRAYRIGQKRDVFVHKLVTEGTLEERIDSLLTDKRALAASVVGAGEHWLAELDDDALRRLVMLTDGDDA